MTTGIEIYDSTGKLQCNGDMLTYALRASGTTTVVVQKVGNTSATSIIIPQTDTYPNALVALGDGGGYAAAYAGGIVTNGTTKRIYGTGTAPVGTSFNYYLFERSNTIPAASFGLEVRDASGNITFSTNQRTMRVLTLLGSPGQLTPQSSNPSYTSTGRTLAYCSGSFAGHRYSGNITTYEGGRPVADGTLAPGPNRTFSWNNDGKIYGGTVTNSGQTVTSTRITWDDVKIGPQASPMQPPDVVWPLNLFIVDVTGIPIGQTFY